MNKLAIIIPVYNEESLIKTSINCFKEILSGLIANNKVSADSFICFIDDGSIDNTYNLIQQEIKQNHSIKCIKLSRNFGQQNAIIAGLFNIDADIYITIDADLQEDINAMYEMIDKFLLGADIVYGIRKDRSSDSFFKKYTAEMFYKFMQLIGINLVYNHSEYRLLSKKAVEALKNFNEKNLFLKATIPLLGFNQEKVFYVRQKRKAGFSKYSPEKLIALAWEGITGFSTKPLKLAFWVSILILLIGLGFLAHSICFFIITNQIPKFEILLAVVFLLNSIQLISIGILGEYLGKTYNETKNRPLYIIEKII